MSKTTSLRKKKALPPKSNVILFPVKKDNSNSICRIGDIGGNGTYYYHIPAALAVPLASIAANVMAKVEDEGRLYEGDKVLFRPEGTSELLLGEAVALTGRLYLRDLNGAGIAYPTKALAFSRSITDFKAYAPGEYQTALQLLGWQGGAQ